MSIGANASNITCEITECMFARCLRCMQIFCSSFIEVTAIVFLYIDVRNLVVNLYINILYTCVNLLKFYLFTLINYVI